MNLYNLQSHPPDQSKGTFKKWIIVGEHWLTLSLEAYLNTMQKGMTEMQSVKYLKAEERQYLQKYTVVHPYVPPVLLVHWLQEHQMLFYSRSAQSDHTAETCGDERETICSRMNAARDIINRVTKHLCFQLDATLKSAKVLNYEEWERKTCQVKTGDEKFQ